MNRSLHSDHRHTRLSSWAVLLDELAVGAVDGAGVAPLEVELDDPEEGAAAAAAGVAAAAVVVSAAGAVGDTCVGEMPEEDMTVEISREVHVKKLRVGFLCCGHVG